MRGTNRALTLLFVVATAAAFAASKYERSEAIYPKSQLGIPVRDFEVETGKRKLGPEESGTFSHQKHLEAGAECESCHSKANDSVKSTDRLLPAHPDCDSCHDIDSARQGKKVDPRADCQYCHMLEAQKSSGAADGKPGAACKTSSDCEDDYACYEKVCRAVVRAEWPRANLIFNHKLHVSSLTDAKDHSQVGSEHAKAGLECEFCHFSEIQYPDGGTGMAMSALGTRVHLPKMETCLRCHDSRELFALKREGDTIEKVVAQAGCAECHVTARKKPSYERKKFLDVGELQLTFASGSLRPMQGDPFGLDHGPRYEFNHGTRAKLDRELCLNCHTELSCMQCHDGLQKPLSVHPNDYITLHPVQARQDSLACQSCHRFQSFCAACHERSGVGMGADPTLRPRNLKVHGDYNAWVNAPGPKHHAVEASRDIKSCVACHREESCLGCHATNAVNKSSRQTNPHPDGFKNVCKTLAAKNDRACLKCHLNTELQSLGCR